MITSAEKTARRKHAAVSTDDVRSMAALLLHLYGEDVNFGTCERIDSFLAEADLLDKAHWRRVLVTVAELTPSKSRMSIH
jgi:hypothetical protein